MQYFIALQKYGKLRHTFRVNLSVSFIQQQKTKHKTVALLQNSLLVLSNQNKNKTYQQIKVSVKSSFSSFILHQQNINHFSKEKGGKNNAFTDRTPKQMPQSVTQLSILASD